MKILVAKLRSCAVDYQTDYLCECLAKNYEFTRDFNEADSIMMLGGCCCTDENIYETLSFIQYILENKRKDAKTYLN